jgi:photosystem II stability/assembly factor-like uncharacterized protein
VKDARIAAEASLARRRPVHLAALAALLAWPALAQKLEPAVIDQIAFREIGPTIFGGRITDIELIPGNPHGLLVAAASGGLFRTTNNGTTWQCIFQNGGTISIGDIAVDAKNSQVIWVGTGEANNQRSGYWGDGIYKTTDGGATWTNVGLHDSHHIGRIVIDPNDSNVVYVAAAGHMYSFNEERGLYKTTDGGATWTRSLYIDDKVGVIDCAIDPSNSSVIYAASYERLRRPWHFDGSGPGSAIWKSVDSGATWKRLEGGLPSGEIARIGVCISPQNPQIVYATVSNENAQPTEGGDVDVGFLGELTEGGYQINQIAEGGPAAAAGLAVGDILLRLGAIEIKDIWSLIRAFSALKPNTEVEVVVKRGEETITAKLAVRSNAPIERDEHGMPLRQIGGEIYRSDNGGETWTKVNTQPIGGSPSYYYGQIRVDPANHEKIYVLSVPVYMSEDGGKTWREGNLANSLHVDHHALVIDPANPSRLILGNDGGLAISYDGGQSWDHYANLPFAQFYTVGIDNQIPYHVYGGTQDNGTWGGPSVGRSGSGITNADWYRVGGGDGFYAQPDPTNHNIVFGEAQFGSIYRLDKRGWISRSVRPPQRDDHEPYRFNWSSPILVSSHNPQIVYFGGNRLFKSFNHGDTWPVISPDLTSADAEKIKGNVPHCTITTLAESPIDPNLLMVGTDDGLVQTSQDGGLTWMNHTGRFPGAPASWWVSRVELSRHDRNVAYVSFTGYREDDFRPLVYVTKNLGQTWESIVGDLPPGCGSINVIREDPRNASVLWLGTEFGAFVSIDRGAHWNRLTKGLPTIAVHDLIVHPRDRDLVLATHGRGFFIADVGAIQELSQETLSKGAHLFSVEDAYIWHRISTSEMSGERHFTGPNPEAGAAIGYRLSAEQPEGSVSLVILDAAGATIRTLQPPRAAGMHLVRWDLRRDPPPQQGGGGGGRGGRGGRGFRGAPMVEPGTYTVLLKVGAEEFRQTVNVKRDPMLDGLGIPAQSDVDTDEVK